MKLTKHLALIATATLAVVACSSNDADPEPQDILPSTTRLSETTRCAVPDADLNDPDQVADAAATILACHDTRSDASPIDAQRRARRYLADHLIPDPGAQIRQPREWDDWAKQNAYLKVAAVEDFVPWDDEPDRANDNPLQLARHTTAIPTNDNGTLEWAEPVTDQYVFTLTKNADGHWHIISIDTP